MGEFRKVPPFRAADKRTQREREREREREDRLNPIGRTFCRHSLFGEVEIFNGVSKLDYAGRSWRREAVYSRLRSGDGDNIGKLYYELAKGIVQPKVTPLLLTMRLSFSSSSQGRDAAVNPR